MLFEAIDLEEVQAMQRHYVHETVS